MTHAQNLAHAADLEAQIAALQAELDEMKAIKPVSVLVLWSENPHFEDNEAMSFEDFETTAKLLSKCIGHGGYDKTKITLALSNGDTVTFRVDLGDDTCAADVVRHYQDYLKTDEGAQYYNSMPEGGASFLDCMNSITL